jgi:LysR family transcriptional regulator, glycine cleavage system transcriptional activator
MQRLRELNLNSLRIAESAARNGSFVRAAEEQFLTPSAVSQRVKMLESQLRFRLFDRRNNSVVLTPDGETFIRQVREGLDAILAARQSVADPHREYTIRIRTLPTFAMRWLLRRLPDFQRSFPKLTLNLSTSYAIPNFNREDIDVAVCYGNGEFDGLDATLLFREDLTPVCAPSLLKTIGKSADNLKVADLKGVTLLHSATCTLNWQSWLKFAGAPEVLNESRSMLFDSCMLSFEAATNGIGFAAANRAYVASDIFDGRLVAPFGILQPNSNGWYVTRPRGKPLSPNAVLFLTWIAQQAELSEREIVGLRHKTTMVQPSRSPQWGTAIQPR